MKKALVVSAQVAGGLRIRSGVKAGIGNNPGNQGRSAATLKVSF